MIIAQFLLLEWVFGNRNENIPCFEQCIVIKKNDPNLIIIIHFEYAMKMNSDMFVINEQLKYLQYYLNFFFISQKNHFEALLNIEIKVHVSHTTQNIFYS